MSADCPDTSPSAASSLDQLRTLDRLPTHVALLDGRGVIIEVNEAWRRFGIENGLPYGGHGVGENYLDLVAKALGPQHKLTLDLQALLAGRSALLTWTYPCHAPDRKRWFNLIGIPLGPSEAARVALIHQEITSLISGAADTGGPPPETSRAALMPDLHAMDRDEGDEDAPSLPMLSPGAGPSGPGAARLLTSRQREVLVLIGQGLTNEEIGDVLGVTPNTVKVHASAILKRLGLKSRTQAALNAERLLKDMRPRR